VHNIRVDGTRAHFTVDAGAINRVMEHLTQFDVRALTSAPPTLEDLFLRHYELRTGESAR
jgi:ABC-2 type transport system ATP-binding protein